jgi:hypothetical protein
VAERRGDFERERDMCTLGESQGAAECDRWPLIPL